MGDSNGKTLEAHKVILASFSSVFKSMLKSDRPSPLFNKSALFLRNVPHEHLSALVDFMYNGEIRINETDLNTFLLVAEDLKIDGLASTRILGEEPSNVCVTQKDQVETTFKDQL